MKQLKVKEVSSILKKYVSYSESRPVLQNANVLEKSIVATNSHHMVRINKSIIENEFFSNESNLFDPKTNTYVTCEDNYPAVDRLFPNSSNVELTITIDNIKRSIEIINYLQHVTKIKKNIIINVVTYNDELVFGTFNTEKNEYTGFYKIGIETNGEISFAINGEYLKSMFTSFKKVLKTIGEKEFIMKFVSNMRPILFETVNKELEILILPVRTYVTLNNVTIAENQDVTIEKKDIVKSVIKKVALFVSGIVRKKVVEHEQINDFMTYLLKEDVASVDKETDQEYKELRFKNLNLFAEIDGHLFHVGFVKNKEKLKQYTKDELFNMIKENYDKQVEEGSKVSEGLKQYFESVYESEKQYNSEPEIEQGKNEGYLQHFASDTVETEKEMNDMSTIQLQGVGAVDAIPASEVKEGDVRLYNFYGTGTVIKVIEKTPKTLTFITEESGKYYMFDIRKTSLVAIVNHDQDISMHNPKEAYKLSGNNKGMVDVSEYFQTEQAEETVSNEKITMVEFTNVEDVWQTLKEGKQVLMNNNELDALQEYVETLNEEDQDIYYHNFSSLFERKFACGLLTRCYVCELYSERNKETEEEKLETYHLELQERGIALTESKPVINLESTYKVIVSKDRENNLIGEFEKVLTGKELEFQLFMNEVLEIIEEISITKTTDELKQELNDIDNRLNKGVPGEEVDELKRYSGELRVKISKSLEQLFSNNDITEAQNARINMLLNEWSKKDKYTFVALYKDLNNSDQICLHVTGANDLYVWFDVHGVRVYSNSFIDNIQYKLKLIHEFNYNRNTGVEHGSIEVTAAVENNLTYIHNKERNSIEISFPDKPNEDIRSLLKANRFRWAKMNKVWYKTNPSEKDFTFVESLGALQNDYNRNDSETLDNFTYPEIEITPIESYTIPQDIQDREHDNNWILRSVKRDHNKEIQDVFKNYQNEVLELLESTDNSRIQYELKRSLQYFKKHYHETYMKYITAKANTPSWITTGRGGMNVSNYNKKMERIDNHMLKLNELIGEMKNRINRAKKQITKEEKSRITAAIESCGLDIQFKMKTKEFTYMDMTEKRKVHTYNDYWIAKTWGCFRVFYKDQEIHSCKTTEKLEHAKKFVAYHIQQEQVQNAI